MNDRTIHFTYKGKEHSAKVTKYEGEVPTRYSVLFDDEELSKKYGSIANYYEIDQHLKYNEGNSKEHNSLHDAVLTELIKIRTEL